MLELPGLLIGPGTTPDVPGTVTSTSTPVQVRAVLDPISQTRVGVIRERGRPWPRWLGRRTLEVCETEDESLLCIVRGPWLLAWAWEVFDAEDRRVAVVRGTEILDGLGRPLAIMQGLEDCRGQRFLGTDGKDLADWSIRDNEAMIQFRAALAQHPLLKMALLGVVLSEL